MMVKLQLAIAENEKWMYGMYDKREQMSDLMCNLCYFSNIVKCWTGELTWFTGVYRYIEE